ncbi:MAG: trigger factor [Lachnospiraceae bacterium]|nr:trigger factor [Candidatus Merdinaster equi]
MSVKVEKLEHNMAKLTVEVPAEEFTAAIEKAYQKNKNKISVPGFRKGKVPKAMVEKMYGKTVFYEDATQLLLPSAYAKACEECEEEIVSRPSIEVTQAEEGKVFIFTAEVAVKPEVELGKYKGVKIEKIETEASEEDVNKQIETERENSAREISVSDRAVENGDIVTLDFEGFVDGVAFNGGKGENYPLTIGSGAFIPGFEEQLIGVKIDEEKDVNVTFPEEYHSEDLKGKAAVFKCKVKEIKVKELPELDDEFASEVSEFDTFAEYKDDVKKKLDEKKAAEAKDKKEAAVIDAIIADSKMDIPQAMLDTRIENMMEDYAQRLSSQGLSLEQYFSFTGMNEETMREQMKPMAEKNIQSRLVLEAVVKAENMLVSDEDYEEEVKRLAEVYQMEVDKVKELLDERAQKEVKEDLLVKKAAAFVVENAKEGK